MHLLYISKSSLLFRLLLAKQMLCTKETVKEFLESWVIPSSSWSSAGYRKESNKVHKFMRILHTKRNQTIFKDEKFTLSNLCVLYSWVFRESSKAKERERVHLNSINYSSCKMQSCTEILISFAHLSRQFRLFVSLSIFVSKI